MISGAVLGIGWDVGGWMGGKQGVAVVDWSPTTGLEWLKAPRCFRLPEGRLLSPGHLLEEAGLDARLLVDRPVVIAIDAPLGFPSAFCEFLDGWPFSERDRPRSPGRPRREIDNRLAYRVTDRHVHETLKIMRDGAASKAGKKPFSASFDKLGNNATVAISHVRSWRAEHGFKVHPMDADRGGDRHLIEVYPALVKQRGNGHQGERVQGRFRELLGDLDRECVEGTDEHDAAICAVLAACFAANGIGGTPKLVGPKAAGIEAALVQREGWIYYPDGYGA